MSNHAFTLKTRTSDDGRGDAGLERGSQSRYIHTGRRYLREISDRDELSRRTTADRNAPLTISRRQQKETQIWRI
jgi:hypothetical protein